MINRTKIFAYVHVLCLCKCGLPGIRISCNECICHCNRRLKACGCEHPESPDKQNSYIDVNEFIQKKKKKKKNNIFKFLFLNINFFFIILN